MCGEFNQFRVSKYNPKDRINGAYTLDEWTAFSDVGRVYNNKIFTMDEYLKTEVAYLKVIELVLKKTNIAYLEITDMDPHYQERYHLPNRTVLTSVDDILNVCRDCLREECWCRLVCKDFFIHFGYDYYVYIGGCVDAKFMDEIASQNGLFSEHIEESPYLHLDYDE